MASYRPPSPELSFNLSPSPSGSSEINLSSSPSWGSSPTTVSVDMTGLGYVSSTTPPGGIVSLPSLPPSPSSSLQGGMFGAQQAPAFGARPSFGTMSTAGGFGSFGGVVSPSGSATNQFSVSNAFGGPAVSTGMFAVPAPVPLSPPYVPAVAPSSPVRLARTPTYSPRQGPRVAGSASSPFAVASSTGVAAPSPMASPARSVQLSPQRSPRVAGSASSPFAVSTPTRGLLAQAAAVPLPASPVLSPVSFPVMSAPSTTYQSTLIERPGGRPYTLIVAPPSPRSASPQMSPRAASPLYGPRAAGQGMNLYASPVSTPERLRYMQRQAAPSQGVSLTPRSASPRVAGSAASPFALAAAAPSPMASPLAAVPVSPQRSPSPRVAGSAASPFAVSAPSPQPSFGGYFAASPRQTRMPEVRTSVRTPGRMRLPSYQPPVQQPQPVVSPVRARSPSPVMSRSPAVRLRSPSPVQGLQPIPSSPVRAVSPARVASPVRAVSPRTPTVPISLSMQASVPSGYNENNAALQEIKRLAMVAYDSLNAYEENLTSKKQSKSMLALKMASDLDALMTAEMRQFPNNYVDKTPVNVSSRYLLRDLFTLLVQFYERANVTLQTAIQAASATRIQLYALPQGHNLKSSIPQVEQSITRMGNSLSVLQRVKRHAAEISIFMDNSSNRPEWVSAGDVGSFGLAVVTPEEAARRRSISQRVAQAGSPRQLSLRQSNILLSDIEYLRQKGKLDEARNMLRSQGLQSVMGYIDQLKRDDQWQRIVRSEFSTVPSVAAYRNSDLATLTSVANTVEERKKLFDQIVAIYIRQGQSLEAAKQSAAQFANHNNQKLQEMINQDAAYQQYQQSISQRR